MHYKVLFLAMSCNDPFFDMEREVVKETWAKDIVAGKYNDIGFYSFTSSDRTYIQDNCIYVDVPNDLFHTYSKTIAAMRTLEENGITWDVLIRTNTSMYFNIEKMMNLLDQLNSAAYGFVMYSYRIDNLYIPLVSGNLMILPRVLTNKLIEKYSEMNEECDLMRHFLEHDPNFLRHDDVLFSVFSYYLGMGFKALPSSLIKRYKNIIYNRHIRSDLPYFFDKNEFYLDDSKIALQQPFVQIRLFGVELPYRYIELEHMYELRDVYEQTL